MEDGNGTADPTNSDLGFDPTNPNPGSGEGTQDGNQDTEINLAKLTVDDLETLEPEKVKELAKKLIPQNKQLFTRAKTAEEKLKPSTQPPNSGGTEPSIGDAVKQLQLAERKRQFGYENSLSPEETDAVFRLSPKPSKEVLDDPFVKGGIAAIRAKKRIEDATPSTSNGSAKINGKSFKDLTPAERDKNFEAFRKQKLGR